MFIEGNDNRGVMVLDGVTTNEYSLISWASQPQAAKPISETAKATQGKLVSQWVIEEGQLVCQWVIRN